MMMTIKLGKNMKTKTSIAKTTNPNTLAGRLRTACATRLLPLLLLTLPAAVQAQYTYTITGVSLKKRKFLSFGQCSHHISGICATIVSTLGLAAFAQTTIPPEQWGTMQTVAANNPSQRLDYFFTGAQTHPTVVTCQFQPSSYSPGSYEPGFVSAGMIMLGTADRHSQGTADFRMEKPYEEPWNPGYTQVWLASYNTVSTDCGIYYPGSLYTIQFTFNRAASTVQIDVTGPNVMSRTVSWSGGDITQLRFWGPSYYTMASSSFGNVVVQFPVVQPPPLVLAGHQSTADGHVLSFSWTNSAACVLESSASLASGWSTVTAPCVTNANWVSMQVTNTSSAQFFRLRSP